LVKQKEADTFYTNGFEAARFDHDPSTLAPRGLLLEGSSTNLLEYSETFDSPWTLSNVQRSTTESTTAPDGTTVYAIETTSGTAARVLYRNAGVINATLVTFSYWFKKGNVVQPSNSSTDQSAGRRFAIYKLNPSTTALWEIRIDGQDPTSYTVITGSGTYDTVAYPNGWYRCRLTTTITTGDNIRAYLGCVGNSTVDGLYWYVWGAQLEVGSGASSYIPTGSGTVQRAADSCVMTGANFSSWFNASEGTFLARGSRRLTSNTGMLLSANDAGNNEAMGLGSSTTGEWLIRDGGSDVADITPGTATANTVYRIAGAYKVNDAQAAFNGTLGTQDTSLTLPTVNQLDIGRDRVTVYLDGHVELIKYWPTRLPDATLQALTQ
jgi:hypothetical protein